MLSASRLEGTVLNFYDHILMSLHFMHPKQRASTLHLKDFTSPVTGFVEKKPIMLVLTLGQGGH